jgi:hypothetical protein
MKSTKSYLIKLSVEIVGGSGDGAKNVTLISLNSLACTC